MASSKGTGGKGTNTGLDLLEITRKINVTKDTKQKKAYKETREKLEKLIIKKEALTQKEKEEATLLLQTLEDILNREDGKDRGSILIKPAKVAIEKLRTMWGIETWTCIDRGLLLGVVGLASKPTLDPEHAWLVFRISLFRRWLEENIPVPKEVLEGECKPALREAQNHFRYMKHEMERRFSVVRQMKELLEFTKHPSPELDSEKGKDNYDPDDKIVAEMKHLLWNRSHEENSSLARENRNMKAEINAIKKQLGQLESEKAELTLRLTNSAGAKLTNNNPDIADLSDPYRPTKLSERYLEIFDNEWTDAYEAMDKGGNMKEQQICLELLNILLKAESECREMAKTQYEQLCSRCTSPVGPGDNGQLDSIHLSLINDLQKQTAKLSISSVQKKILKDNKISMKSEVVEYQMKCVEICWYMSLQTPPMVLDKSLKEGQAFDSERYNWYTRKGKYVEFVVWPPLLLHKDGPLLCKGVAQVK